jgi:hypothetical protein
LSPCCGGVLLSSVLLLFMDKLFSLWTLFIFQIYLFITELILWAGFIHAVYLSLNTLNTDRNFQWKLNHSELKIKVFCTVRLKFLTEVVAVLIFKLIFLVIHLVYSIWHFSVADTDPYFVNSHIVKLSCTIFFTSAPPEGHHQQMSCIEKGDTRKNRYQIVMAHWRGYTIIFKLTRHVV